MFGFAIKKNPAGQERGIKDETKLPGINNC